MLNPFQRGKLKLKNTEWKHDYKSGIKPDIIRVFEKCSDTPQRMKPSGKAMVTKCPFHDDTKPSFALYKETSSFYCFSCGATGSAYDLAMKLLGMDFRSAAEFIRENGLYPWG